MNKRTQKSNAKSSTFFGGAAILAASIAVVKVIGALYKIPLGRILGDVGFGHFNNAYAIYNLLLMVSTAGLPVAMSKTISEANALNRRNQVSRVFHVALVTFIILGSISSLIMFIFAQPLANLQGDSLAAPAVRVMALSCFFVCTMSAYRGYAQGHSDMVPTAVSQVLEAMTKLIVGLFLAWYLLRLGFGSEFSAAGAIAGVTASGLVSLVYLMIRFRRKNSAQGLAKTDDRPESAKHILKVLASMYAAEGEYVINGRPCRDYRYEDFRRQVTLLSQKTFVYSASIRDNLTMFSGTAQQDEALTKTLADAGLSKWYAERGASMDTQIGGEEHALSGGEERRLDLARTLWRKGSLVMLDEPAAGLDEKTRVELEKQIAQLPCEILIVAMHNYSPEFLDSFTKVLRIRDGEIVM